MCRTQPQGLSEVVRAVSPQSRFNLSQTISELLSVRLHCYCLCSINDNVVRIYWQVRRDRICLNQTHNILKKLLLYGHYEEKKEM